ncbi:cysteine hydrolase family protein [Streptomyces spiralis]|uniref:cysteine hydrolase family protein n=1 Tax=Streptomyces spiralis TaxID=66376 RepID=UPI0036BCE013
MSADLLTVAHPRNTALLIIDMNNDFVHPDGQAARTGGRDLTASRSVIPTIVGLAADARAAGVAVIHCQHTTLPGGVGTSSAWAQARAWATYSAPEICLKDTWGHAIIDALAPQPGDIVVHKYRYGAFTGTQLELILHSLGRDTAVCCGISTNVCVEDTARQAFANDMHVVLPEDACASWDMRLHAASLETARQRYATVTTSAVLRTAWAQQTSTT